MYLGRVQALRYILQSTNFARLTNAEARLAMSRFQFARSSCRRERAKQAQAIAQLRERVQVYAQLGLSLGASHH